MSAWHAGLCLMLSGFKESDEDLVICVARMSLPSPILVGPKVDGKLLNIEVDTGVGLLVISEHTNSRRCYLKFPIPCRMQHNTVATDDRLMRGVCAQEELN